MCNSLKRPPTPSPVKHRRREPYTTARGGCKYIIPRLPRFVKREEKIMGNKLTRAEMEQRIYSWLAGLSKEKRATMLASIEIIRTLTDEQCDRAMKHITMAV